MIFRKNKFKILLNVVMLTVLFLTGTVLAVNAAITTTGNRAYLLPDTTTHEIYKAQLHAHSTMCDGTMTPTEVVDEYINQGYDIFSLSSHEGMINLYQEEHFEFDDATLNKILLITGAEFVFGSGHYNFYAPILTDAEDLLEGINYKCPAYTATSAWLPHTKDYVNASWRDNSANRDVDNMYNLFKECVDAGFLITMNHPEWSGVEDVKYLEAGWGELLWGVEYDNDGSYANDGTKTNGVYDDTMHHVDVLLRTGTRVNPIAADDSHYKGFIGQNWQSIYADLTADNSKPTNMSTVDTYKKIYSALTDGDFYSSNGPVITALYVEDGKIELSWDSSKTITEVLLRTQGRYAKVIVPEAGATSVSIDISDFIENGVAEDLGEVSGEDRTYIRLELYASDGSSAVTRGYFYDEFNPSFE